MHENSLTFHFEGTSRIELVKTEVLISGTSRALTCIRGKTSGAYLACGSFQWTSGVRGVCVVFLRFMISEMSDLVDCCLVGRKGSLAASLDYALSKGPAWLGEMFGNGARGQQTVRRLLRVSNPNRKRPGPVAISVNKNAVTWDQVRMYWDDRLITDVAQLHAMLIGIEEQGGDESGRDGEREAAPSHTTII